MSTAVATPISRAEPPPDYAAYSGPVDRRRRRLGFLDLALADSPWSVGDLVRVVARLTVGLIVIVVAWAGASGTVVWRRQLIWTGVGMAGVVLAAAGVFMWLLSGIGMVSRERREIRLALTALYTPTAPYPDLDDFRSSGVETFFWGAGMRRFHLLTCDVVKGKSVKALSREDCGRRGLEPCGMCQP